MARTLKVLIEASGCLTSTYMIDSIKSAGHLVCGSDIDSFNASYAYCDDFILMPRADSPTLWEEVSALLLAHKIDVVIPTLDESLLGWSERKEYFASLGIAILLSPPHTIETFIDKWRTYRFFRKIGIPTPNTALYHHYGILKPRYGRGGSGIQKETEESMNRFYKAFSRGGGRMPLVPPRQVLRQIFKQVCKLVMLLKGRCLAKKAVFTSLKKKFMAKNIRLIVFLIVLEKRFISFLAAAWACAMGNLLRARCAM